MDIFCLLSGDLLVSISLHLIVAVFLGSSLQKNVCVGLFLCPCFCLGLCLSSRTLSMSDPSSRLPLSLSKSALSFL